MSDWLWANLFRCRNGPAAATGTATAATAAAAASAATRGRRAQLAAIRGRRAQRGILYRHASCEAEHVSANTRVAAQRCRTGLGK